MDLNGNPTLNKRFLIAIGITLAILFAEIVGGLWTGSHRQPIHPAQSPPRRRRHNGHLVARRGVGAPALPKEQLSHA